MFIGIFGIGQKHTEPKDVEFHNCPSCNHSEGQYLETYSYFHFFFIPLIKFSKKAYVTCNGCNSAYSVDPTEKHNFTRYDIRETLKYVKRCPSCGHPLNSTDNFCPHCGQKL